MLLLMSIPYSAFITREMAKICSHPHSSNALKSSDFLSGGAIKRGPVGQTENRMSNANMKRTCPMHNISQILSIIVAQTFAPTTNNSLKYHDGNSLRTVAGSFSSAAPVLWNSLPLDIKSPPNVKHFQKRLLKNHFFSKAYIA